MKFNDLILRTLAGEKCSRPPVWLMRQAGRYMNEYMEIRKKVSFLELCRTPELACEVTLQPVDILGVDAAILFSDILVPVEHMGVNVSFNPAPVISNPVRTFSDADALKVPNMKATVPYVYKAIEQLVSKLNVPLIGFCGAPFTLACYMVEGSGSKNFLEIKKFMHNDEKSYNLLMDKLTDLMFDYLKNQISSGCSIVQIFDTWAGILSPEDYRTKVLPWVKRLTSQLANFSKDAYVIYFAKDGASYYKDMQQLNCAGIGVDWKTDILDADAALKSKFTLQGNLDPALLFTNKELIKKCAAGIIAQGKQVNKGHIFNLGHGIMPGTPVDNVQELVRFIKGEL